MATVPGGERIPISERRPRGSLPLSISIGCAIRSIARTIAYLATFGWWRRRHLTRPLIAGEIIVGWVTSPDLGQSSSSIERQLVPSVGSWWIAGAARALAINWHSDKEVRGPVRTWVVRCRPGWERDLVATLAYVARRIERSRRFIEPWRRGSFVATRVPRLVPAAPPVVASSFALLPEFGAACRRVGATTSAVGSPLRIGVIEIETSCDELAAQHPNVTATPWTLGPRGTGLVQAFDRPDEPIGHGNLIVETVLAVVPEADVHVFAIRSYPGDDEFRSEVSASWLFTGLDSLRSCHLINVSLQVDRGGLRFAPFFEDHCRVMIRQFAETRPVLVIASAGNPIQQWVETRELPDPSRPAADERMVYPARDPFVVAVGSLTNRMTPWQGNRVLGKESDLLWMMPGGTSDEPFGLWDNDPTDPIYGTSLATALFTGCLARAYGTTRTTPPSQREELVAVAREFTRSWPGSADPRFWGRGHLHLDGEPDPLTVS